MLNNISHHKRALGACVCSSSSSSSNYISLPCFTVVFSLVHRLEANPGSLSPQWPLSHTVRTTCILPIAEGWVAGVFLLFFFFLESLVLFLLYYILEKVYSCRRATNSAEETALHLAKTAENRPVCNKDVQSLKRPVPSHNDCMCYQSNTCLLKACSYTIVGEKVRGGN